MDDRRMRLCARGVLALVLAVQLAGCNIGMPPSGTSPVSAARDFIPRSELNQPLEPGHERVDNCLPPRNQGEPIVLLSISGGGSRSAYYAARVMEEMSRIPVGKCGSSLLENVRVISTVSAGSLAAAWYVAHYDERNQPDFYERFKQAMGVNLQWRTYGHMAVFPPLALQLAASNVTRTDLLAAEIDKLLGTKGATFDDFQAKELRAQDPAPVLLMNGTVYNSGQRLVMTNLPPSRFPSPVNASAGSMISISEADRANMANLIRPLTFADFGSDIGQMKVAHAIAASAAYPVILAPVRLRVYADRIAPDLQYRTGDLANSQSIYIADGGMYENEGVDALLSLIKTMDRRQPILLVVVDASQRMRTVISDRGKVWDPITVIARMYDIGTLRPLAFYGTLLREFHDPDRFAAVVVRMQGDSPEMETRLRDIPTMFKLGARHREALDAAASANVEQMRENIVAAYGRLTGTAKRKTR